MAVRNSSFQRKSFVQRFTDSIAASSTQQLFVGAILFLALLAFEVFNFDTNRYALSNLLGGVEFAGFTWAAILAIAFCAIDFAGLSRMFTPETGRDEPAAIRYLTGAWFLGATMNAVMTWWAVSLTLLSHPLGNEVLSREQLLQYVPIFVATLVWITRILFIGSIAVAGDHLINGKHKRSNYNKSSSSKSKPKTQYARSSTTRAARPAPKTRTARPAGANFSGGSGRPEPASFSAAPTGQTTSMTPVQNAAPARPTPARPTMKAGSAGMGNVNRTSRLRRRPDSGGSGSSISRRPPTVMQAARRKN